MSPWSFLLAVAAGGFALWWYRENARRTRHPVAPGLHEEISLPHEQEFELYHNALSLCSMKARVCMAELRLPYESHPIDLIETGMYENIRAPFLAVNPGGTVPVLVHRGHPVYESHEQIRYAARHAPEGSPELVPSEPELVRQMEEWIDRSSLTDDPINHGDVSAGNAVPALTIPLFATMIERIPVWKIVEGLLFHFDRLRPVLFLVLKLVGPARMHHLPPVVTFSARGRRQMHAHFDALEEQLSKTGGPWIVGEPFTLADVSWLVIFERLVQTDALAVFASAERRPHCSAYWERLRARPSYAEAIEGHSHPLIEYGTRRIQEVKEANGALRRVLEGAAGEG